MCLSEVYDDEQMQEAIEALPEVAPGVVEVWKVVAKRDNFYVTPMPQWRIRIPNGIGIAPKKVLIKDYKDTGQYWSGWHVFATEYSAKTMKKAADPRPPPEQVRILKCLIKKDWVGACGLAAIDWDYNTGLTFVVEKAFFPTFPSTEARLEDFLEWQKTVVAKGLEAYRYCEQKQG